MLDKLKQLIRDGEGLTVEFKRCENELTNSVFETVSSFSNRYGGYILLGVEDDGEITGINPGSVNEIKKNFVNSLNNSQRFAPTLYISLEEVDVKGRIVLWCYIPPNSQVVMFGNKIYDRGMDGDMDITRNVEMVSQIYRRKSADYLERKVFPYAKESDFDFTRLMPIVRQLATHHRSGHQWSKMTDMEIIKSAGLYEKNVETGTSGFNLAAILLFGRDEVIQSCTANYITDAICRRENLDRYDDRLMVTTNLIDAYEQLDDFIAKHTLDKFHIIDGQSVSVRSIISKELVSNILVHRDYASAYPAKIIIERNRIVTENWALPKKPGPIDPEDFMPFPRNPILARFFTRIGRADVLGSGVRNLYEFTKLYSGGTPELIDGDVFRTTVPLSKENFITTDKLEISDKLSDNESDKEMINETEDKVADLNLNLTDQAIYDYILANNRITAQQVVEISRIDSKQGARKALNRLVKLGIVKRSGSGPKIFYEIRD
jgi:ATP-dependent DNA helicase RecG